MPSATISCGGVPQDRCDEAVAGAYRSLPTSPIKSIEVLCVSGTCTSASGAMETVVTLIDGSQLRSSTISWSGPQPTQAPVGEDPIPVVPPPAVPVAPVCQGVPASMCDIMAETAFGELSTEGVAAIVVRCGPEACTADKGTGETIVTYQDGSSKSASWQYAN